MDEQKYYILNAVGWLAIAGLIYTDIFVANKNTVIYGSIFLAIKSLIEASL